MCTEDILEEHLHNEKMPSYDSDMIVGSEKGNVPCRLGEDELIEINKYKYMGVWMGTNGWGKQRIVRFINI